MHFMGKLGLEKVSKRSRRDPDHEKTFLTFTLSVNKIILYQFSMFKSLDSIASVVGMFMYLTISKLKQVLRSRKGLGKVSTTTLPTTPTTTSFGRDGYGRLKNVNVLLS